MVFKTANVDAPLQDGTSQCVYIYMFPFIRWPFLFLLPHIRYSDDMATFKLHQDSKIDSTPVSALLLELSRTSRYLPEATLICLPDCLATHILRDTFGLEAYALTRRSPNIVLSIYRQTPLESPWGKSKIIMWFFAPSTTGLCSRREAADRETASFTNTAVPLLARGCAFAAGYIIRSTISHLLAFASGEMASAYFRADNGIRYREIPRCIMMEATHFTPTSPSQPCEKKTKISEQSVLMLLACPVPSRPHTFVRALVFAAQSPFLVPLPVLILIWVAPDEVLWYQTGLAAPFLIFTIFVVPCWCRSFGCTSFAQRVWRSVSWYRVMVIQW